MYQYVRKSSHEQVQRHSCRPISAGGYDSLKIPQSYVFSTLSSSTRAFRFDCEALVDVPCCTAREQAGGYQVDSCMYRMFSFSVNCEMCLPR
jgi:hypothetical protein